jgi:ABC-type uncharacterized transport system substrate-binding protein
MKATLITLVFILLGLMKTYAHPHVFIDTKITVVFGQNTIEKLFVQFDFDPMFSAELIHGFDANASRQFEKNEIKNIYKNAFSNLKDYNYFIHFVDAGKKLTFTSVSDFNASINSAGKVQYTFTIDTDIKTNIANKKVKMAAYDHSYYFNVRLEKANVSFINQEQANFTWSFIQDKSMAYYFDQIYPNCAVISFK